MFQTMTFCRFFRRKLAADSRHEWNWFTAILSIVMVLFFGTLAMLAINESAEMKYVFLVAFGLSDLGKAMVRKYMHEHVK